KSPINGTIFDLDITGNNYETLKGERLLGIMPDSNLEAKVFVLNKDIGFIKKNMEVKLKVDSHPYTQFGYLYGKVEKIGDVPKKSTNDLISSQSKYPVFIELQNQYLDKNNEKYILRNGQSITASFKVRKKPFISLFSDVFERITDSLNKIISKKSLFFQNREE
ncbi:HlyD family efflux transporter periplasmic adaptor subunit, partial [uncultured Prochlorococcus sp.]|uniref:HlyD family efflux transporter periplasmic adaptor subunit n=1 Tax=uncultured Prochlorococcus sp. TaxID=159733 RepID=UPI0025847EC2